MLTNKGLATRRNLGDQAHMDQGSVPWEITLGNGS